MKVIDLQGPEGNAFSLMGTAKTWAKQLEKDVDSILDDMKSSDYNHLLDVFEREFSTVCRFINDPRVPSVEDDWDDDLDDDDEVLF